MGEGERFGECKGVSKEIWRKNRSRSWVIEEVK